MAGYWEDSVSINTQATFEPRAVGSAHDHLQMDDGTMQWDEAIVPRRQLLDADRSQIPEPRDREGYYGDNHFNYWASGARDLAQIAAFMNTHRLAYDSVLDFGCASGRMVRHYHYSRLFGAVAGCDINRLHVDWCAHYLPSEIVPFQSTSMPTLPLADNSLTLITAFSVFTHIEAFEDAWLMEFRRILRPGGIAWITVHSDRTWREVNEHWPLYNAIKGFPEFASQNPRTAVPRDRMVFRWHEAKSYSANVFYSGQYIRRRFGQFLEIMDMFPAIPGYQDIVVMRKRP